MINQNIRPLPYYSIPATVQDAALAKNLRVEFRDKVRRRLSGHHLSGFTHRFIIDFVRRNKKKYPFYLKTDISLFYPNIRHTDLVVGVQLAYRELLCLDYVPSGFKKKYVAALHRWCSSLPLSRGIPIGNPVSAIAAPVMLIPLWLQLKRMFRVPFIVYQDDLLVMCKDAGQCAEVYALVENSLRSHYDLELNRKKTNSGRFSTGSVDLCGWRFAGGYSSVTPDKIEAFMLRLTNEIQTYRGDTVKGLIKRLNYKIDGFGNYYKYGNVGKLFHRLDIFIRAIVRKSLKSRWQICVPGNDHVAEMGLHSLLPKHEKVNLTRAEKPPRGLPVFQKFKNDRNLLVPANNIQMRQLELCEKILKQLVQITSLQRKQNNMMHYLITNI